jgi:hypothetical protein
MKIFTKILLFFIFFFCFAPLSKGQNNEEVSDMINWLPSPIEISFLMKDLGIPYNQSLLSDVQNLEKYSQDTQQALNLGLFAADLGYINVYQQNQDAKKYLDAIETLCQKLNVLQVFDFKIVRQLNHQSDNLDSLLIVTDRNLKKINEFFQNEGRTDLTILILTGGWIEALYLTCEAIIKNPNDLLKNRIAEQKIILNQLTLLLNLFDQNKDIANLLVDLKELEKVYDNIKIVEDTTHQIQNKNENGTLIIEDNATNKLIFTEKDLNSILIVTKKVREKILN